jgi:Transglycosylase SLT domain
MVRPILALLALLCCSSVAVASPGPDDGALCAAAIARSEAAGTVPSGLLTAVAVNESGRYDSGRRGVAPWPWTVNNAGDGRYFTSKEEAIAHVERLRAAGERNIDVGCMQINLMHHPDAFASLEDAFEPSRNVAYGARFLGDLREETQSWERAVERYHTADPERGRAYREKVYERWAGGAPGPTLADAPPRRLLTAGLEAEPAAAPDRSRPFAERPRLLPLADRGFISLSGATRRVDILRPSSDRQLKPIIRPPQRSSVALVRLIGHRQTLLALGP